MFENMNSMSVSGGRGAGMRLEALEDRTTPAVVGDQFGAFAVDASALSGITVAQSANVDRAFLAEVARVSVMEWFIGSTVADRGSDPQIREFGRQLAANQLDVFNQVLPVLQRSGIGLELTAIDQQLVGSFPALSATDTDAQFLFFSSLYGLQSLGLAQTAGLFSTDANVRAFAQGQISPLQSSLQTGFGFLGTDATTATINMFANMGGFGPFSTGLGTSATGFGTGFGTNAAGSALASSTTAPVVAVTPTGLDSFSTTGPGPVSGGFGPGASFGSNTGFGPANSTTGIDTSGFGPANSTAGSNTTGFGPASTFATPGSNGSFGSFGTFSEPVPLF